MNEDGSGEGLQINQTGTLDSPCLRFGLALAYLIVMSFIKALCQVRVQRQDSSARV